MNFIHNKKLKKFFICSLILIICFATFSACKNKIKTYEIALVTDVGRLMDNGFNQGSYEGIKEFAERNFLTYNYYEPEDNNNDGKLDAEDTIEAMHKAIANGAKIIVAPGFAQGQAIEKVAKENENIKFIYIDGEMHKVDNVASICYREGESGYIAGYAAVKEGYKKIGVVLGGGGTNPACNRYGYGFLQGIKTASKEDNVDIEMRFSYKYGETYNASDELEAQMDEWYKDGVELVFACGGAMVDSVVKAAEKTENGKIIGVDVDQSDKSERIITSAIKNLKYPVIKLLGEFYSSRWDVLYAGRISYFGAESNATGIVINPRLEKFKTTQYKEIIEKIESLEIIIDDVVDADCNNQEWFDRAIEDSPNIKVTLVK